MSCGCGNYPCAVSPSRKHVEVIRDPTPAPVVRREVKRNPTPPGDIIERVKFIYYLFCCKSIHTRLLFL
jgi:hypothetical protein